MLRTLAPRVLALPLLWIGFELLLALLGVGEAGELLPYQELAEPLFVAEPAGARFVAQEDRLGAQTFALAKPPGLARVFCLGGSAVRGLGYSPNVSIPRYLERCLAACGLPGRRFEVVNGGVIGISSRQVRRMCAEVVTRYAPDLVVVCTGNNEFLELHARKYRELQGSGALSWIRDLRSFHLLRSLLPRRGSIGPSAAQEIRLTASEFIAEVEITAEEIQDVLAEYRANLEAIARACTEAGVPLVLMTVPANLRWNDPHPEADWDERVLADWEPDPARRPATRPARIAWLLEQLEEREAHATGSERSRLAFLRGKCQEERGELEAARSSYLAALDADEHRRRTTSAMNALVASVARAPGVHLLDTVGFFQELETIPGFRLMYDHIHYTPEGALRVAGRLAEEALALLAPEATDACAGLAAFQAQVLARLAERIHSGEDFPAADEWVGFCFDPALVEDRDLWKYQRQVEALQAQVAARDAPDVQPRARGKALTYLGNALSFEAQGAARARASYAEALELVPEWSAELRRNLALLGE